MAIGQDTTHSASWSCLPGAGVNQRGQLGNNTTNDASLPVPVQIPRIGGISYLSGMTHIVPWGPTSLVLPMQRSGTASNPDRCHPIIACSWLGRRDARSTRYPAESSSWLSSPSGGVGPSSCRTDGWRKPCVVGVAGFPGASGVGRVRRSSLLAAMSRKTSSSGSTPAPRIPLRRRQADYGDGTVRARRPARRWNHNLVKISDRLFCFGANDILAMRTSMGRHGLIATPGGRPGRQLRWRSGRKSQLCDDQ